MNGLSGFQIVAANGLQSGEGIAPPNITANLSTYLSFAPVNNFSNIYATASTLPFGLTSANANLLLSLGANSFPHVFGQVPNDFNSNLGSGPLFNIAHARTTEWFGNVSTANVYIQILGQAQTYAATARAVLGSAASTQWAGGPASSATGGFSSIGGNDPEQFQIVANAISELGTLMIPSDALNGFSNADCFNRILNSGNDTIGNLHLNFFGKTIVDPVTGNTWIIGSELFAYVMDNPVGLTSDDQFKIAALNPLDSVIGKAANDALLQTGDLDAVVTFFNVGPIAASAIYEWTDCLNLPLMLGSVASQIISSSLSIGNNILTPYYFINGLVQNISGLSNIISLNVLGSTMAKITPLTNSPDLLSMNAPITQSQFSNLQATFGPGSGTNGNPTVDDVMGSTNYNQALSDTILGLKPLTTTNHYANISTDTANIKIALTSNIFPVTLSNGTSYTNINSLAVGGASLINQTASNLGNIASSLTNISLFTSFNKIAQTHNNSISLSSSGSLIPINPSAIVSNLISGFTDVSGFVALILSIIQQYYGMSMISKIDNPSQSAVFQKFPGGLGFSPSGILTSFPSSLASMAAVSSVLQNSDEITGLNQISNCFDTSVSGQALHATIKEAQNSQVLSNNGLLSQSFSPNTTTLVTPKSGINTIGGA